MKFFKSDEWKILWPFYSSYFVFSLFFIFGPYWIVYFLDIGLSFKQISVLIAVFAFMPILFEVPTGAIADIFGRKFSVILGHFLQAIFIGMISFFTNFYILLLIFLLMSISSTLGSGSWDAWIVDLLKHKKKNELVQNFYVKFASIGNLAVVLMGVGSALFVKYYGIRWTFLVTGIGVIASTFLLFIGEEYFKKQKVKIKQVWKKTWQSARTSASFSFKHPALLYLLLAATITTLAFMVSELVWQPFMINVGLQPHMLGYVFSLMSAILVGVPFLCKPLLKKIGNEKHYLILITSILVLLFLSVGFIKTIIFAIAAVILLSVLIQLEKPVLAPYFQKFVPSKIRATTGSLKAMMIAIGATIGTLIGGVLGDVLGPQMTIVASAFILIPAIFLYLKIKD